MAISWSTQQLAFLDWCKNGKGSCVLIAVAGAGKSTTLIEASRMIPGQVALLAYNKKAGEDLKEKLKKAGVDWKKGQAGTVHSFGFSNYRKFRPHVRVDEFKVRNILSGDFNNPNLIPMVPPLHYLEKYVPAILQLVSLAKQRALGVFGSIRDKGLWFDIVEHFDIFNGDSAVAPVEDCIGYAMEALEQSNNQLDIIDFDDMVYLPVFHKIKMWRFDAVFLDEAQDTNPARRALVSALLKPNGRLAAVGDPCQAIYGFTGADADSIELIKKDFNAIELPLTITYRCPKAVVKFSQQWVSHIQAAEEAPEGIVSTMAMANFMKRNDLDGNSAVLCRLTKPVVALAFALIRKRIPCRVEGRDVAKTIKKLITRWKVDSLSELEERLDDYLAKETTKLLAKKQETKLAQVEDLVETVKVIIDQCQKEAKHSLADANDYVDQIFGDNVKDMLVLSTIHKSKGREWERVYWLDRMGTCPSKWARQKWQIEQENNLCYVAATRAKEHLIDLLPTPKEG